MDICPRLDGNYPLTPQDRCSSVPGMDRFKNVADAAIKRYLTFFFRHKLLMYLAYLALIAALWLFFPPTIFALIVGGTAAYMLVIVVAHRWWMRRASR
jgi:hypothetical protein